MSHFLHPFSVASMDQAYKTSWEVAKGTLRSSYGHVNLDYLRTLKDIEEPETGNAYVWSMMQRSDLPGVTEAVDTILSFWQSIESRISDDAAMIILMDATNSGADGFDVDGAGEYLMKRFPNFMAEQSLIGGLPTQLDAKRKAGKITSSISPTNLNSIVIDMNEAFAGNEEDAAVKKQPKKDLDKLADVELVIVRPNIEHNMLGIIMGLGGDSLGNTLWGQTELSVYDDSMHGIWGMSYKYHERAIVFNERNLIRLWDIAYDGYNGGKDDTYVDWMRPEAPNGFKNFQELTMDVSKNYRGPSMMVMAFVHDRTKLESDGHSFFEKNFKRNWPSPIVFHDNYNEHAAKTSSTLPLDYDNLQVVDVDEFRVFNNSLYASAYSDYKAMMPAFHEMHIMRKSAGQASAEAETQTDSLAFQGSMRVKENGIIQQDIQGSGHHGPDYTGVASVRAGKGQKVSGQAPTLHRLI